METGKFNSNAQKLSTHRKKKKSGEQNEEAKI